MLLALISYLAKGDFPRAELKGAIMIDYKAIEEKWQKAWADARIFEPEINDKKEPYLVFAAFPYVNSPQHIGHLRTYGTADVNARYKRMRGYNVLFPMGMHATGTPILAFAKRIAHKDTELINELKYFGISESDIMKMVTPEAIASYFIKEMQQGMKSAGLSIDWRHTFVSTDPFFSKFVEWQFGILNSKGLFVQGKHPVGWCPNENNAVGMHDTRHDVEPEIEEVTAIKFKVAGEDAYMLCATFRPETIFGVTNIFVNENARYSLCNIGGDKCYVSAAAAELLKYQMKIEVISTLDGKEMILKKCESPIDGSELPVLPGFFVKDDVGTGIVMSVPAHAPFDYAALERLKASGYNMPEIKPKKIIEVNIGRTLVDVSSGAVKPEHPEIPALAYLEVLNTHVNAIDDMLEFATKLQYREESNWGKMLVKGYEGMAEKDARPKVEQELIEKKQAIHIYMLTNAPVTCRCGANVVVKVVEDQWFLNYGDAKWKAEAKKAFEGINILPAEQRNAFAAAIDWINLRAVARAQGLGTRFPLDNRFIIESLSDSTIYMAFYTIANMIRNISPEKLKPEFFDFVFLGKGDAESVAKSTGIDYTVINDCRESFTYWYKNTSSHSGTDLIFNHLTMYIFNHTAVFSTEYWPRQIVVNGSVLSEGEKMSKSIGNIVPLNMGITKYGVDPLRMVVIAGADLISDSEFSDKAVNGVRERFEYLYSTASKVSELQTKGLSQIDYWLYSRLNRTIEEATKAMDKLELRTAATSIFYNAILDLKHYFDRKGENGIVVKEYLQSITLMLQPLAPHIAEELWHILGNESLAAAEKWPEPNAEMINQKIELSEDTVNTAVEDLKNAISILSKKGVKPKEAKLIVASPWKREFANALSEEKNIGKAIERVRAAYKDVNPDIVSKYAAKFAKEVNTTKSVPLSEDEEYELFSEAADYLQSVTGCEIKVEKEEGSNSKRAERAVPLKPSIEIS